MPVVTSIIAASTAIGLSTTAAVTVGVVGGALTYGAIGVSSKAAKDEKKAQANMAADAAARSAAIEKAARESELQAEANALEETRKRLASTTQTIFTSPLGIINSSETRIGKTTLGST